jgi:hypothetical protein
VDDFVRRDVCDGVVGGRLVGLAVVRIGSMQFGGFQPLDTLIATELEGEALGANNHGSNIDENLSIDGLSCEIVVLVGLDVESRHQLYIITIMIFYQAS